MVKPRNLLRGKLGLSCRVMLLSVCPLIEDDLEMEGIGRVGANK